ncbi:MAG: Gfo/Idh/MocA family oxidoreductase [Phycisphaerales bacterium]|nr:Gfo/Idh/MocA family oxidoreductase [Phycisphaerales bacterium]
MGNANLRSFLGKPQVQVLAVCDPDRDRRLGSKRAVEEHYAGQTTSGLYGGCDDYNDFRDLLGRKDIDAVIIASPDHWHGLHGIMAAKVGKDIYGEKPLTLTIAQGRAMSDTIARYGRVFQTGSQQRSDRRFRLACELVRNGRLGRIHHITCHLPPGASTGNHVPKAAPDGFDYEMWLGPAPWAPYCDHRTHYDFRYMFDYSGGKLTDWGAHHIDIAQWALGMEKSGPVRVSGVGEFPKDGLWDTAVNYKVTATYENGVELIVTSHDSTGVEILGDEGRLFVKRGHIESEPSSLLQTRFAPNEMRLYQSDDHHQNFLDCIRSGREPIAPIEDAHRTITIAHLGNIAMRLGTEIHWDPTLERAIGNDSANRMLGRAMRSPWRL